MEDDYSISDYNYIGSSIGNAYFSGLTFDQLWQCVAISETREQLDAAVSATIDLNNMLKGEHNG